LRFEEKTIEIKPALWYNEYKHNGENRIFLTGGKYNETHPDNQ